MKALIAVLASLSVLVAGQTALSWNKPGHMVSAAIAYADLNERHPTVLAKVLDVLKQHPQANLLWEKKLVKADDRDLYLFMLAARWPDDVRKKYPEYDRPAWHSVKIPYRPGKEKVKIPHGDNIIRSFRKNRSIAKSAAADEKARAVALCWMLHLTGDVHQPLHTIKLVTKQFPEPEGDRGGSGFYVRVTPSSSTISLHKLWDRLLLQSDKFQIVRNIATKLRNRPGLKRDGLAEQLAVKSFKDWALGSHAIAVDQAYRKGTLRGGTEKSHGVVLPSDYVDKAKSIAERQIVLSGYRISDAMVELFGR